MSVAALFARLRPVAYVGNIRLAWEQPPSGVRRASADRHAFMAAWRGRSPEAIYADYEEAVRRMRSEQ